VAFTKWAFIYLGVGTEDPDTDRAQIESGGLTTTVVAVPTRSDAARVAVELVDAGAQSIELCGGFGVQGAADVMAAVGDRVPVGLVGFGPEATHKLAVLFPA
jgi:Family of unknown function (DUF6506)